MAAQTHRSKHALPKQAKCRRFFDFDRQCRAQNIESLQRDLDSALLPAAQGVRIVSNNMGNVPARMYNSPDGMTPATSRPETFFFKK